MLVRLLYLGIFAAVIWVAYHVVPLAFMTTAVKYQAAQELEVSSKFLCATYASNTGKMLSQQGGNKKVMVRFAAGFHSSGKNILIDLPKGGKNINPFPTANVVVWGFDDQLEACALRLLTHDTAVMWDQDPKEYVAIATDLRAPLEEFLLADGLDNGLMGINKSFLKYIVIDNWATHVNPETGALMVDFPELDTNQPWSEPRKKLMNGVIRDLRNVFINWRDQKMWWFGLLGAGASIFFVLCIAGLRRNEQAREQQRVEAQAEHAKHAELLKRKEELLRHASNVGGRVLYDIIETLLLQTLDSTSCTHAKDAIDRIQRNGELLARARSHGVEDSVIQGLVDGKEWSELEALIPKNGGASSPPAHGDDVATIQKKLRERAKKVASVLGPSVSQGIEELASLHGRDFSKKLQAIEYALKQAEDRVLASRRSRS